MFSLYRSAASHSQVPRRRFLQAGLVSSMALAAAQPAPLAAAQGAGFGRAKRCLLVFLNGGPSQLDTWDLKPEAPAEIRGELKPIATSVPGLQVGELLPELARLAHRYKIVRSVTHTASVHTTGVYTMLTGTQHRTPLVDQNRVLPDDHPHLGSTFAYARSRPADTPGFVCLPTLFRAPPVEGIWPGQTAGFLGRRFDPLVLEGDKATARFRFPALELPAGMTAERLADRRVLSEQLDALRRGRAAVSRPERETDAAFERAWSLVGSRRFREALEIERESSETHARYGRHLFGQGVLLARRLLQADVPFVTVYWIDPEPPGPGGGEFDSHGQIYRHMRQRLMPPADRALAALIADLWNDQLSDDTLLVVMSEFGRTPRINKDAGRDHWPDTQSILLAGAGITGGSIYGGTDRHAASVASDPVTPPDLGQTILHLLGVPKHLELQDPQGRVLAASKGEIVPGLLA